MHIGEEVIHNVTLGYSSPSLFSPGQGKKNREEHHVRTVSDPDLTGNVDIVFFMHFALFYL